MRSPRTQTPNAAAKAEEQREREKQALHLRKAGASYRAIGEQLGVSHEQVRRDIEKALEYIREDVSTDARKLRDIEAARLDDMWLKLQSKLNPKQGEPLEYKAIDTALRIMERRAKLLGLDAPVQIQNLDFRDATANELRAAMTDKNVRMLTYTEVLYIAAGDETAAADIYARAGLALPANVITVETDNE